MYQDLQYIKTRANLIRQSFIEDMEKHLLALEQKLLNNSINVIWVKDEEELSTLISSRFQKPSSNKIAFDVSIIPKEFQEKNNLFKQVTISELEDFSQVAEHLVVQANFGIVETGAIVLIDKASKACYNRVENLHIILDLNNVVVKQTDLEPLLSLMSGPQKEFLFPKDIKIISGLLNQVIKNNNYGFDEKFSLKPVNTYVYFYDNGITTILQDPILRESLYCINCGKCKEACPVFKHTQKFTPIELVYFNCFEENRRTTQIFENTSLCGNCNEVCPVLIPITDLLIFEMQKVKNKHSRERNIDLFKYFNKRARMNKLQSWFNKYFFLKKQYPKNKKLESYFKQQKLPFFNTNMSNKTEKND